MTEFLDVDGGQIAYELNGDGPLVVLSHGIGNHRQVYRFLSVVLSATRRSLSSTTPWPRSVAPQQSRLKSMPEASVFGEVGVATEGSPRAHEPGQPGSAARSRRSARQRGC